MLKRLKTKRILEVTILTRLNKKNSIESESIMDERNSTISLEMARNGSPVVKTEGVYLHSIYDPEKEADSFVETYEKQLQAKNHILIFGLGLGYHVNKVAKFLKDKHVDYRIVVLETNRDLIGLVEEQNLVPSERIKVFHLEDYKKLYAERSFVNFLMQKPCLLKHEASFSLHKEKYAGFLTYKSHKKIKDYSDQLTNTTRELISLNPDYTISEIAKSIKSSGHITNRSQYLTLALDELLTQTRKGI